MPQLPAEVKAERSRALRSLGDRLHSRFLDDQAGSVGELLIEAIDGSMAEGITREHVRARVAVRGETKLGALVPVRLGVAQDGYVNATLL
jgi:tRNA A37 methylthiotransferase MiaB